MGIKGLAKSSLIVVLAMVCGYLLLVVASMIPQKLIYTHISEVSEKMYYEGNYPSLYMNGAYIENFSDADAYAVAYNQRYNNPFINALDAFNYAYDQDTTHRGVKALYFTIPGSLNTIYEHSHAWHGYRIILRPLLIFWNLADIRSICFYIVSILSIFTCCLLYNRNSKFISVFPFAVSILFFFFTLESMTFLFFLDFVIMLASCIFIIIMADSNISNIATIMTLTGFAVAYFDLFNMPLITVGFPIVLWISISNSPAKKKLTDSISLYIHWFLGFALTTFTKMLISHFMFPGSSSSKAFRWYTGIIGNFTISDRFKAIQHLIFRAFDMSNIRQFLIMVFIISLVIGVIKKINTLNPYHFFAYVIPALIPFVWIFVLPVHATMDWTIFIFAITIYSLLQLSVDLLFT